MKVLTSSQMFSAEQAQVNRGMSFTRLMENAGSAAAAFSTRLLPSAGTNARPCART